MGLNEDLISPKMVQIIKTKYIVNTKDGAIQQNSKTKKFKKINQQFLKHILGHCQYFYNLDPLVPRWNACQIFHFFQYFLTFRLFALKHKTLFKWKCTAGKLTYDVTFHKCAYSPHGCRFTPCYGAKPWLGLCNTILSKLITIQNMQLHIAQPQPRLS